MTDITELKNKKVDVLCRYITDDPQLYRFVETLSKYDITTLSDLENITNEVIIHKPGFGKNKLELLKKVKKILQLKREQILFNDADSNKLSDIPDDILEISLDWIIESYLNKSEFKRIRNTLETCSIYSIKDILNFDTYKESKRPGIGKGKVTRTKELQETIISIISDNDSLRKLQATYIESRTIPTLPSPSKDNESYASLINRFIDEVSNIYDKNGRKDCAKAIRLAYQHEFDIIMIAKKLNKTRVRIEQLLTERNPKYNSFLCMLRNKLNTSEESNIQLYKVSDSFRNAIQAIDSFCNRTPSKNSLLEYLGDGVSNNIINFVLDYLGGKIFGGETGHKTRIKEQFVVVDCDLKHLNKKWGFIFTLLDKCVKPIEKERLQIKLQRKFTQLPEKVENKIISIIENSRQFEVERTDLTTSYSLTWKELLSMQSRLERILFESKNSMQRQQLENEYNRRLRECGEEEPIIFKISASKNIHELRKGGTWIWNEYAIENETQSITNLISRYVAKNQKFLIEEIMEYLNTKITSINEQSVKTILTTYCYSTTEKYYIDKNSIANFTNLHIVTNDDILPQLAETMDRTKEYTYNELYEMLGKRYPISKIRRTCNDSNVFIIIKGIYKKIPNKIRINPNWDGYYDTNARDGRRGIRAEWKKNVRAEIINKLRYSPNYEMESRKLCKHFASYIPKEIKNNSLYRILQDESIFIVRKNESGRGNIIKLNTNEWEKEFKQHLVDNEDSATKYNYDKTDKRLLQVQQQQSNLPLYNLSPTTDDLDNLFISTQSLVSYFLKQLEKDKMGIADLKNVWSFMVEQMNVLNGGVDNAYYRMFNQLYGYMFGSTTRNDRYFLWVETRLNYEPYLRNLLVLKGFSIVKPDGKNMQLKDLINLCQKNNILPKEYVSCCVTDCITNVLKNRNHRGHNAEETPNDTIIVSNIQKTLILYLYTSMKLKQYEA